LTDHGHEAFPGSGHQTAQEEEVRQLKRELERVRQERDIFKKAVAIFSRRQP
jgi:transposase